MVAHLKFISSQNGGRLRRILSLTMSTKEFSPTSAIQSIISSVARMIDDVLFEGVEIHWQQPSIDDNSKKDKANLVDFMKVIFYSSILYNYTTKMSSGKGGGVSVCILSS
jgi:hypothetical protein